MVRNLLIVGASGFGREVLQWVKDINKIENRWNILGFLDDNLNALDGYECDYKVVGKIQDWNPKGNEDFVIAIANPVIKERVVNELESKGAKFVSVIHPTALIGGFNHFGRGVVVYPYAKITVNTKIGDFVTLLGSNIGHDVVIKEYATICGLCSINGHVQIGKNAFVGSHVVIAPSKKVGNNAYVGNGSVVITNIRAGYKVYGNPAKRLDI
ncbi:MAG: NeuD/PglB/VioB family sugar acetyltransferase [Acidaminococcaceae bacterium]|nr:NeuD/PglB/VioB family sugar acetyltransferase [Acidaminococcaceae bacterium]